MSAWYALSIPNDLANWFVGVRMVDSEPVCGDDSPFHGRAGFFHAVSVNLISLRMSPHSAEMRFRTSAGLYYFSAKLAPPKYSALASWITGWANITGQVGIIACSASGFTSLRAFDYR